MAITPKQNSIGIQNMNIDDKNKLITQISEIMDSNVNLHDFVLTNDDDGDINVNAKVHLNDSILNNKLTFISTLEDLGNYSVGNGSEHDFDSQEQLLRWWLFESDEPVL
jgi:hypothetical protein